MPACNNLRNKEMNKTRGSMRANAQMMRCHYTHLED
jgi:hypothetical protein